MKEVSQTEILHTLDYWWAEANNEHNDGWVQQGYKNKIIVVLSKLKEMEPPIKFESTKEEMCF